ncbi:UDP-N-acetylmuramate--L-alanine ligase [Thermoflavimicrobium dichotomicum]|uniref:UDP-N-acetylmuramate--L-alanine ligase n=1 Tax=Thermoflavimicrobium dichotomicum TaxID=46223 RepID=A0A1I3JLJ6_9BACL|nr:UDP-N-acetylmuramate--L-alanine ligase [Thermoflavimicrobium dichotomicum]SFI61131.1 UDP-N-acetylmuramate--alanine ligase [Thermoflavimicrobium dichotomicum]
MAKYHLIGIKGAGMSALAQVLHEMGYEVRGSDQSTHFFTQKPLEALGIEILPFDRNNIQKEYIVIASNAYQDDHEEVREALHKQVEFYRYHEFLGRLIEPFTSISVTGTHGKTSTSGLLAHVLGSITPTAYIVGDGTGRGGKNYKYFVLESCEYRRHFLSYFPDYAVITNINFDHPDYFSGIDHVKDAFQQMVLQVKKAVVACGDDPHTPFLTASCPILYYGFQEHNQLIIKNLKRDQMGTVFELYYQGNTLGFFRIPMYGTHHVLNSVAVIGICVLEDMDLSHVRRLLPTFQGVRRRFAENRWGTNIIIDDYAHHPREVQATMEAARNKYPDKKLVAIFQPHTYSRLKHFLDGFAEVLQEADDIYLCDIFGSARESEGDISIRDLLHKLPIAKYLTRDNITCLKEYDSSILLFMGAGDIQKYQEWLIAEKMQEIKNVDYQQKK